MNGRHTLFVVSQVAIYREGLTAYLEGRPELRVLAAVASLDEAVKLVSRSCPDLCVADITEFDRTQVDYFFMAMAREEVPVIVLGLADSSTEAISCLEAGASGYLSKDGSLAELQSVIEKTLASGACVAECDVKAVVSHLRNGTRSPEARSSPCLTPREIEIASHLLQNRTNVEIARRLGISAHTVKHHVRNTLSKLGMDRRTEVVAQRTALTRLLESLT